MTTIAGASRDRLAKLVGMIGAGGGEAENAGRMLAQECDLHGLADFIRTGVTAEFVKAASPFFRIALAEVQQGDWALSGDMRIELRRVSASFVSGSLSTEEVGTLWDLLGSVRKRLGRQ